MPFDKEHVIYVWIDALSSYITALGYSLEDDSMMKKYWPADVHLREKKSSAFTQLFGPIMLMASRPSTTQTSLWAWLAHT